MGGLGKIFLVNQLKVGSSNFAVTVVLQLVGDLLAFVEGGKTGTLNSRNVNECVFAAIVWLNEAETFGGVEEFNGADSHSRYLI